MAQIEGWDGGIIVGTSLTDAMTHWKVNLVQESIDDTDYGTTTPDRTFSPGLRAHTVEFSGNYSDDAGMKHLTDKMLSSNAPSMTTMIFLTQKTTGAREGFKGVVLVENIGIDSNVDGLVAFSGSGKVSGGLDTYSS